MVEIAEFSTTAHRVMVYADEEARARYDECIDTPHVLLGLTRALSEDGRRAMGIDEAALRSAIGALAPPGPECFFCGELPVAWGVKELFRYALEEGERYGCRRRITSGGLWRAMLRNAGFVGFKALALAGVGRERVLKATEPVGIDEVLAVLEATP